MTKEEYRAERKKRGTMAAVAELLGIHVMTLFRRENGDAGISGEAITAMQALPLKVIGPMKASKAKRVEKPEPQRPRGGLAAEAMRAREAKGRKVK